MSLFKHLTGVDFERPQTRTDDAMKHMPIWSDLPPSQAGLAAALRRAFKTPANDQEAFEDLLRKLG